MLAAPVRQVDVGTGAGGGQAPYQAEGGSNPFQPEEKFAPGATVYQPPKGDPDIEDEALVDKGGPIKSTFGGDLTQGGQVSREDAMRAQENEQQSFNTGRGFAPGAIMPEESPDSSQWGGKANPYTGNPGEATPLSSPTGEAMGDMHNENAKDTGGQGNKNTGEPGYNNTKGTSPAAPYGNGPNGAYTDAYGSGLTTTQHEQANNAVFPGGYGTGKDQWTDSSIAGLGKGPQATSAGSPRSTLDGVHGYGDMGVNTTETNPQITAPTGQAGMDKGQDNKFNAFDILAPTSGTPSATTAPTAPKAPDSSVNASPATPKLSQRLRHVAWTGWGGGVDMAPSSGGIQPIGGPFGTFPGFGGPTSTHHTASGWDWDDHMNGYLSNQRVAFTCDCGEQHPPPPSYRTCSCGRTWNSYGIGRGDDLHTASVDQYICREIPRRDNVIVANRKLADDSRLGDTGNADDLLRSRMEHGDSKPNADGSCQYCGAPEGHDHANECPLHTKTRKWWNRGGALNWRNPVPQGNGINVEVVKGDGWWATVHPNGKWSIDRDDEYMTPMVGGNAHNMANGKANVEKVVQMVMKEDRKALDQYKITSAFVLADFGTTKYDSYSTKELTKLRQHSLTNPHSQVDPVELNRELSKREVISRLAAINSGPGYTRAVNKLRAAQQGVEEVRKKYKDFGYQRGNQADMDQLAAHNTLQNALFPFDSGKYEHPDKDKEEGSFPRTSRIANFTAQENKGLGGWVVRHDEKGIHALNGSGKIAIYKSERGAQRRADAVNSGDDTNTGQGIPHGNSRGVPVGGWGRMSSQDVLERLAALHDVTEPGELGKGKDPKKKVDKTFRQQPPDWARRDDDGKWYHGDGHIAAVADAKKDSYHKGWMASKRTTTYDMGPASDRHRAKGGDASSFEDGWSDWAADLPHRYRDPEGWRKAHQELEPGWDEKTAFTRGYQDDDGVTHSYKPGDEPLGYKNWYNQVKGENPSDLEFGGFSDEKEHDIESEYRDYLHKMRPQHAAARRT